MTAKFKEDASAILLIAIALGALLLGRANVASGNQESTTMPAPCQIALQSKLPVAAWSGDLIERIRHQRKRATAPRFTPAHLEQLGWSYAQVGRLADDADFYALAMSTAACIEQHEPGTHAALLLRGHVLHNQHEFKQAGQIARRLVEQRGAWFDFALLGDTLLEQGDIQGATSAWQKMMDLRPGPQAYRRAAHLRWRTGDIDGAIDMALRTAQSTSPRNPLERARAHADLAHYLWRANRPEEARRSVEIALRIAPGEPRALAVRHLLSDDHHQPDEDSATHKHSHLPHS